MNARWVQQIVAGAVLAGMPGASLLAQKAGPERVGGRVTSSADGHPLPHATVTLEDVATDRTVATASSATDGSFQFEPVAAGHYRLHGRAKGFAPALYLQHGLYSSAIVTGAGLATGSLNLQLTPAASIAGHVLDEAGEPIPLRGEFLGSGATVTLYCEQPSLATQPIHICGRERTASDGSFEFPELEPGRYYLTASARPWYEVHSSPQPNLSLPFATAVDPALDVAYPLVYYPNALSSDQAEPLVLQAGDQVTANMQMQPEKAMFIAIPHPANAGESWSFPMVFREIFGSPEAVFATMDSSPTMGYIMGLPQGQYTLMESNREDPRAMSTLTVNLHDQSTTLNAGNQLATSTVTLRMHLPNGAPVPEGTEVRLQDSGTLSAISRADSKGVAEFPKVPEGDFPVTFDSGQVALQLFEEGKPVAGHRLHVTADAPVTADLTMGAPLRVQGVVRSGGRLDVGAMVVLVPASGAAVPELFARDQSDLDGGFTFQAVAPGNYLVVALGNAWALHWTDAHVLEPYLLKATPLLVPATAHGTLVMKEGLVTQTVH